MMVGPDFDSDDDGMSDDDDYFDFQERIKRRKSLNPCSQPFSEADQTKKQLQAVYYAIISGKVDVVLNELDKGLDVNVDLDSGWAPLLLSASVCNADITAELLKRGANVNHSRDGSTPLMLACGNSSDEKSATDKLRTVRLLVESGANVHEVDRKRKTVLMYAAGNSHLDVVEFLLPLCRNKEAKDNQKWTALFWAVDGNKISNVERLLNDGFSCDITDVRDNTPAMLAEHNNFYDIVSLFPQNETEKLLYTIFDSAKVFNFEEIFDILDENQRPKLFTDICKILYGVRCECLIPIVKQSGIGLADWLAITNSHLERLGVALPYQRNRIISGLYRFHKQPFHQTSLKVVPKTELYSNIDVACTVLTSIQQMIAMEASISFMMKNLNQNRIISSSSNRHDDELLVDIPRAVRQIKSHVNKLTRVTSRLGKCTEMWDLQLRPVDRIGRRENRFPWFMLVTSVTACSVVAVVFVYKQKL